MGVMLPRLEKGVMLPRLGTKRRGFGHAGWSEYWCCGWIDRQSLTYVEIKIVPTPQNFSLTSIKAFAIDRSIPSNRRQSLLHATPAAIMPSTTTTIGKTRAANAAAAAVDAKKRKSSSSAAASCVSVSSTAIVLADTPPSAIPLAAVSSHNSSRSNEEKQMDKTMTGAATTSAKQKQSTSPSSSSNDAGMEEDRKQKAMEVCTQLCDSSARPLSFAELVAQGLSAPVSEDDLSKPAKPGTLHHTSYGNRSFENSRRFEERREKVMENHKGKSIDEAIEDHAAHKINFTAPVVKAAGEALGLQGHLKKASRAKKGHEKKMGAILPPTSELALPQQHSGLSGEDLANINYRCAYMGTTGVAAGYKHGELGTIVNAHGKTADAARSKATKALQAAGLIPVQVSKNMKKEIPKLCLNQGKPDSIPANSLRLIDKDNNSIDHSNKTDFKRNLHRAHGFEILQNFDAVVAIFYKSEANTAGKDKKEWKALRNKFMSLLKNKRADIRFTVERILDGEVVHLGPANKRLKLAGYRF
eukprot:scaffold28246_cov117-Skeletonema_marinoi.AAC.1